MTTLIICVNFKIGTIKIKSVVPIGSFHDDSEGSGSSESFFCQDTLLEEIDLRTIHISARRHEYWKGLSVSIIDTLTSQQPSQLCHKIALIHPTVLKHRIDKWIRHTNAEHCVVDMTEVNHSEFKQYSNFITDNFSSFSMLHS